MIITPGQPLGTTTRGSRVAAPGRGEPPPLRALEKDGSDSQRSVDARSDEATDEREREAIRCAACGTAVSTKDAVFTAPGADAATMMFANPHGRVFEVMTVRRAWSVAAFGEPTTEFTWFSGYAWRVALCASCGTHLGWAFDATAPDLEPRAFWGLVRDALVEG